MTLVEIRAKCRRLKQKVGLKLVVIDYLQLMTSGKRVESRQQEVSEFSRALKLLAKELQVPVIALSQLNRGAEQRADKMPAISDLRESGSIEQDADMVILLHREAAYEKDSPRAGEADLIVAKHRNGPTRTVTVGFHGHYSRFVDLPPATDPRCSAGPAARSPWHRVGRAAGWWPQTEAAVTRESDEGRRGYWAVLLGRGILAGVLALLVTFNADHSPVLGLAVYGAFVGLQGLLLATTAARSARTQVGTALTLSSGVVGIATGVLAGALLIVAPGAADAALVPTIALSGAAAGLLELLLGLRREDSGVQSRDHVAVGAATLLLVLGVLLASGAPVVTVGLTGAYGAVVAVYLIIAALSLLGPDRSAPTKQNAGDTEEVRGA
ncbi:hypothetical protein GCM10025866_12620 [Naasia aerilata]|uniref:SF4 helicase domain-containing protein n=1 Tax=Naasia aerilata TaxID=1162966 RepID=A0ABN6XPJ6_9MICO|nr:hypothetical protein GCM10025866_12620 [Naasia aerilata]